MKIHYFQRYHGKENVATANTMLLLSRLYSYSSEKFYRFVRGFLLDDTSCALETKIQLQTKAKNSVPDAFIFQPSFLIVVETKMGDTFTIKQLCRHLNAFSDKRHQAEYKVLFTIAPVKMNPRIFDLFRQKLDKYNNPKQKFKVQHINATFDELIEAIQGVIDERDDEMQDILDDYKEYCIQDNLFNPKTWRQLRVRTAGRSLEFSKKANLYYESAEQGFQPHAYFGLYDRKSVCAIGKIKAIIKAVKRNGKLLTSFYGGSWNMKTNGGRKRGKEKISNEYKKRIKAAMEEAKQYGHNLYAKEHFYFFVDQFYETDFKKSSPYGLWKVRYFDLVKELGLPEDSRQDSLPPPDEIAERLKSKTWE